MTTYQSAYTGEEIDAAVEKANTAVQPATNSLDGLSDVNVAGATDGQALVYDFATETWVPGTVGGSTGGSDLTIELLLALS